MNRFDHALGKKPPKEEEPVPDPVNEEEGPTNLNAVPQIGPPMPIAYNPPPRRAEGVTGRARAPIRIVWADGLNEEQLNNLREQVELALADPSYTIVANYQIHWEEYESPNMMGPQGPMGPPGPPGMSA